MANLIKIQQYNTINLCQGYRMISIHTPMEIMEKLKYNDLHPIEGFKVMEWIREVREKEYTIYKKDPKEYFRNLQKAGEKRRRRSRLHKP